MRNSWWLVVPIVAQFGFDFSPINAFFEGALGAIQAEIAAIFSFLWGALLAVFNYLLAGLKFLLQFFYGLMLDIQKGLKWLWENVVKGILTKVLDLFVKVRAWLVRVFGPVIRWLLKVRAILDRYFNLFVRPILNLIRHVRQVLQLFRLLGFKWAKALDARFALVENRIVQVYELLRTNLNKVISSFQLILDPTFLLRRSPLFGALIRSAAELRNVLLGAADRPLTSDESKAQHDDAVQFTAAASHAKLDYFKQGKLPPDMEASRQVFLTELAAIQAGTEATSA